jgi:hypothetical protein
MAFGIQMIDQTLSSGIFEEKTSTKGDFHMVAGEASSYLSKSRHDGKFPILGKQVKWDHLSFVY